jgi:hypothetical protein
MPTREHAAPQDHCANSVTANTSRRGVWVMREPGTQSQPLLVVGLAAGEPLDRAAAHAPRPVLRGSMIADAVRYMSVDSRNQPDIQGRNRTTTVRSTTARTSAYAQATGRFRW